MDGLHRWSGIGDVCIDCGVVRSPHEERLACPNHILKPINLRLKKKRSRVKTTKGSQPSNALFVDCRGNEIGVGATVCFYRWGQLYFGVIEKVTGVKQARLSIRALYPEIFKDRVYSLRGVDKVIVAY